jgi:hypothetical protein
MHPISKAGCLYQPSSTNKAYWIGLYISSQNSDLIRTLLMKTICTSRLFRRDLYIDIHVVTRLSRLVCIFVGTMRRVESLKSVLINASKAGCLNQQSSTNKAYWLGQYIIKKNSDLIRTLLMKAVCTSRLFRRDLYIDIHVVERLSRLVSLELSGESEVWN